jgi:heme-degrading monooxygenase HmoA
MYARVAELTVIAEKRQDLINVVKNEYVPALKRAPGFVDYIALNAERNAAHVISISFWKTKDDGERFYRESYPPVMEKMKPFLKTQVDVKAYNVDFSTFHHITAAVSA